MNWTTYRRCCGKTNNYLQKDNKNSTMGFECVSSCALESWTLLTHKRTPKPSVPSIQTFNLNKNMPTIDKSGDITLSPDRGNIHLCCCTLSSTFVGYHPFSFSHLSMKRKLEGKKKTSELCVRPNTGWHQKIWINPLVRKWVCFPDMAGNGQTANQSLFKWT